MTEAKAVMSALCVSGGGARAWCCPSVFGGGVAALGFGLGSGLPFCESNIFKKKQMQAMQILKVMRTYAVWLLTSAMALSAWAQTPTRAMQVGDKWVYRFEDPGNKKTAVEQLWQVVHVDGANAWMYSNDPARPPGQQETMVRWDQVRGWRMEGFALDKSKPLAMGKRLWNVQLDDDWFQFP